MSRFPVAHHTTAEFMADPAALYAKVKAGTTVVLTGADGKEAAILHAGSIADYANDEPECARCDYAGLVNKEACATLLRIAELSSPRATSIQREIHTAAVEGMERLVVLHADSRPQMGKAPKPPCPECGGRGVVTESGPNFIRSRSCSRCPQPITRNGAASPDEEEVGDATWLARLFHSTYERLAPSFGYETRPDTREFDPASKNGRLMVAVCGELLAKPSERSKFPPASKEPDDLTLAAWEARHELGKALYSETGIDRRGAAHAYNALVHALDALQPAEQFAVGVESYKEPGRG